MTSPFLVINSRMILFPFSCNILLIVNQGFLYHSYTYQTNCDNIFFRQVDICV